MIPRMSISEECEAGVHPHPSIPLERPIQSLTSKTVVVCSSYDEGYGSFLTNGWVSLETLHGGHGAGAPITLQLKDSTHKTIMQM